MPAFGRRPVPNPKAAPQLGKSGNIGRRGGGSSSAPAEVRSSGSGSRRGPVAPARTGSGVVEAEDESLRGRWLRLGYSVGYHLVALICLTSVLCVVFLKIKLAGPEEIMNIPGSDGAVTINVQGKTNVLQIQNENFTSFVSNIDSRDIAFFTIVVALVTPFMLYKYMDHLPCIRCPLKRYMDVDEEAPLRKRIAYRADVFFSVYPYAKLLALLFATILLIGLGGVALYSVTNVSFGESLWLSWTFVADSGNHADQVGIGPRIVSVLISSGGMLIFAMMLGLISDAISEKVDSLRKGKSEVLERGHVLILGWSDKLVIARVIKDLVGVCYNC